MSVAETVTAARAFALEQMTDTCTITRGGGRALNRQSGKYDSTPGEQLYDGPCRVKPRDNADRVVDAGDESVSLFPFLVSVPVGDVHFEVDDVVIVTSAPQDPALTETSLRVRQVNVGSHLSTRRLGCEVKAG